MRNHEAELKIFTVMLNDKIIAMFDSLEKKKLKKGRETEGDLVPLSFSFVCRGNVTILELI